jgi:hypothetical protein
VFVFGHFPITFPLSFTEQNFSSSRCPMRLCIHSSFSEPLRLSLLVLPYFGRVRISRNAGFATAQQQHGAAVLVASCFNPGWTETNRVARIAAQLSDKVGQGWLVTIGAEGTHAAFDHQNDDGRLRSRNSRSEQGSECPCCGRIVAVKIPSILRNKVKRSTTSAD